MASEGFCEGRRKNGRHTAALWVSASHWDVALNGSTLDGILLMNAIKAAVPDADEPEVAIFDTRA